MKVFIALCLLIVASMNACPGCLDSSWHLARRYDTKSYHQAVTCYDGKLDHCQCPCRKLTLDRGECIECRHRHIMPEMHIVRYRANCK